MCDILVGLPNLPKFGTTGSLALGVCVDQSNRFPNARPAAPLLVPALGEVAMHVNGVCDPCPVLLSDLKLSHEIVYDRPVIASMSLDPSVARGGVVLPGHISNQRQRLVRPNDQIIEQPRFN